jgi:diadenosine tetraphosphate (Ap4A) HIT family hydrolase
MHLSMHFLPNYATDLNPNKLIWINFNKSDMARRSLQKKQRYSMQIQEAIRKTSSDAPVLYSHL